MFDLGHIGRIGNLYQNQIKPKIYTDIENLPISWLHMPSFFFQSCDYHAYTYTCLKMNKILGLIHVIFYHSKLKINKDKKIFIDPSKININQTRQMKGP